MREGALPSGCAFRGPIPRGRTGGTRGPKRPEEGSSHVSLKESHLCEPVWQFGIRIASHGGHGGPLIHPQKFDPPDEQTATTEVKQQFRVGKTRPPIKRDAPH